MFWVFDEVKRGIYKRNAAVQEPEIQSKNGANIELPFSDALEIKGIQPIVFTFFLYLSVILSTEPKFLTAINSY
jgi:hypothetical protein